MSIQKNRLIENLSAARQAGRKTLLPFITAGYPDAQTTTALLAEFFNRGISVCELGFPFSDPVADGPVIQASYTKALDAGVTSEKIFQAVREYRAWEKSRENAPLPPAKRTPEEEQSEIRNPKSEIQHSALRTPRSAMAINAMVSYSIVYRHGPERFFADAAKAGCDGLIIPDLPFEEARLLEKSVRDEGLCNVLLIAPTTPPERQAKIAKASRGFVYYISVAGITGARSALPEATIDAVAALRRHTGTPICVGFGISSAETVRTVCGVADGAIVGSAIVSRITKALADGAYGEQIVKAVGEFVSELQRGTEQV